MTGSAGAHPSAPGERDDGEQIYVGIDVGGTKALILARAGGRTVWSDTRPTGRGFGPTDVVDLVTHVVEEVAAVGPVGGVGLGIPGLVDVAGGRVRSSVILDGWDDVPLGALVTDAIDRPCRIDNDVNNAARAELAVRRADEPATADLMFIAAGTGIGGALVLGGRVWTGITGAAGEVGHMAAPGIDGQCDCGRFGCVAVAAGGRSIESHLGAPVGTLGEIELTPRVSDELAHAAGRLGEVVADAMNLLNLPLVVVGGGVAAHPGFVVRVDAAFRAAALDEVAAACSVEPSRAGYSAGALGAALLASEG